MAKRVAKTGGRRRLIVLGGIAALSLVVVVVAVGQQNNKSKDTEVLNYLTGEVPDGYALTPERAQELVDKSIEADRSLDKNQEASTGNPSSNGAPTDTDPAPGNSQATNPEDTPFKEFNSNEADDNDPDCPVTGCNGPYEDEEPTEEQMSGEQILADLASGSGLESTLEARHEALEKALAYFEDSVAANPNNEDAHYSLAFVYANLAATYFSNADTGDNYQGIELAEKARSSGEEAKALANSHNNSTIAALASSLIDGVIDYIDTAT